MTARLGSLVFFSLRLDAAGGVLPSGRGTARWRRAETTARDYGQVTTDEREGAAELPGRFWLADAPEAVVPGRLGLGAGGPRVHLDGQLTPFLREVTSPDGLVHLELARAGAARPVCVHGDVAAGPVSLVDALGVHWGPDGQRMQASYAMLGGHVAGREQRYTDVRVRLRYLDEWAALPGFARQAPGPDRAAGTFERPDLPAVELASGARLGLEQVLESSLSPGFDGGRVSRTVWLDVLELPPLTWEQLGRGVLTPLATLLTLAVDADCPLVEVEARAAPDGPWLSVRSAWLRPPADRPRPLSRMLAPRHVLGLKQVARWLDRVEDLGPLPPVVAAAAAAPPRTVESGVLELATAAEGLARRLWRDWDRLTPEQAGRARADALDAVAGQGGEVEAAVKGALEHVHEPSYPLRLLRLVEHAGDAVPGVVGRRTEAGRPSRWKSAAVEARNDFAHRLDKGWLDEGRVGGYVAVYESLRWLLTGVLLLEAGLSAEVLAGRFTQHEHYQLFLEQAPGWLPRVYGGEQDGSS